MSSLAYFFSRNLHTITWTTLTLHFMLLKFLSCAMRPSPKLADWFTTSFLWMSEYHFVKRNLLFITWYQQMKCLQMCYVQAIGPNKIHFLAGMKAHIISHSFFTGTRAWMAYKSKGRKCFRQTISWKPRALPFKI